MTKMTRRLYEIDILRFLSACFVIFFHYTLSVHNQFNQYLIDNRSLNSIFLFGNFGVVLFFVISGFVILMSAQNCKPLDFIKARALRLYPAFVPICILSWIAGTLFITDYNVSFKSFLLNLTLVGTFVAEKDVSGVYWTLRVEIIFYLLIFCLIVFKKIQNIRIFLSCWLVLSVITYFGIQHFNYFRIFNKIRFLFITQYSYFFIAGCYFYLMKFQRRKFDIIMPVLCLLCSIVCYSFDKQNQIVAGSIITAIFLLFYYISLKDLNIGNEKTIKKLGAMTYPLYLIHELFGLVIIGFLIEIVNGPVLFLLTACLVVYFSAVFNKWIESPLTKAFKKLLK